MYNAAEEPASVAADEDEGVDLRWHMSNACYTAGNTAVFLLHKGHPLRIAIHSAVELYAPRI